jgi:class 3 adenylate cyclase
LPNGDVIEKHDVFGDGVNIAARLEQIAPPGGLWLSEDAYRQVPVMLPPGCDRLATRSVAHRITHEPMTTGIDVVACYAARAAIVDMRW